ncbi:Carboxyl-terminal-processing protease [Hyella patelloides LEGE 07179]|uniref:Carboxyl-terminal-processing protease n=1 Tax=Hyella patelloides LEGE 07179 TaxID=945734 RepID=A0A563VT42_9CYAN|nr:carboxyl-terminal processing protease CtpA [Hyella patelloides]VEP14554.1 Carboxyl-terminal-processing protease [Hyella patelloides LEGE 07179]
MLKKAFWVTLLVFVWCTFSLVWLPTPAQAFTEQQKLLLQSWRIVNQSYVDETFNHQNWWLLRQKLVKKPMKNRDEAYDAIDEMLATLDDPFTRLLRPEQYRSLQVSTSGELSGVGLQINVDPQTQLVQVISPLAGSPAALAGIESRDYILEIDGIDTKNLTLDEAAATMRGKIGTEVSLRVQKHEDESVQNVRLIRDRIELNPVYAKLDRKNQIGYVRLTQFSANAAQEIAHSVVKLEQEGAKSYILDLRNNPGGLLQSGVEVARLWLDQGTIVYTVNRQGTLGSFDSNEALLSDAPLVVLVNSGTASSSEILAGALQDNGRASLVGEKTFGKGLIQSLFELPNGAGIAVTVAKYETPSHKDINKLGIEPDRVIKQEAPILYTEIGTEKDVQYKAAVEMLTNQTIAHAS